MSTVNPCKKRNLYPFILQDFAFKITTNNTYVIVLHIIIIKVL